MVALGADYDLAATPGLTEAGHEFYSVPGAEAVVDDGSRLPFDLFLGIPVHRAPTVVEASGMTVGGWIPVDPGTLATRFPGVYAVGDVTSVGTPKAGVFAGALRAWWPTS